MQRPDQYLRPRVKVGRYSRLRVVDMWAARGNEAPGNREVNGHHEQGARRKLRLSRRAHSRRGERHGESPSI